ncbi:MAG: prmC 2 [Francisellaceae bacterium]|nr:prmC 2 [Francisellaceae bacterium]
MKSIHSLLHETYRLYNVKILDRELLLESILNQPRIFFKSHPEYLVNTKLQTEYEALLKRRDLGEPLAYILQSQEFWSLNIKVSPDVLIPRPETELLVEKALELFDNQKKIKVLELGTGSGAIAIALAYTCPNWEVTATDLSQCALELAQGNALDHQLNNIKFIKSNWFEELDNTFYYDLILSNPPYIDIVDPYIEESVKLYEPKEALFSKNKGLSDLETIIKNSNQYLKPGGILMLEHGFMQKLSVNTLFSQNDYLTIQNYQDLRGLDRITLGQKKS